MHQVLREQVAVMVTHPARERLFQCLSLRAHPPFGQLRQDRPVRFAANDGRQHDPRGHAGDVGGNAAQLQVGPLQHLL